MTTNELDSHQQDWVEVLHGVVPEDDLVPCYLAAIRNPLRRVEEARFPVKVTELLAEYYKLKASRPGATRECDFCRQHKFDPTEFPPCQFHPQKEESQ